MKNRDKKNNRVEKKQIVVPLENDVFQIFKELGPQIRFQMLSLTILVGVGSGVWPKSAWSPSYEKIILEIAQIWTTPVQH